MYIDLLRLPLPVVFQRVYQRFFSSEGAYNLPQIPAFTFNQTNPAHLPEVDLEILLRLYEHYKRDEFNHLGSGWTSLKNKDLPSGFAGTLYAAADEKLDLNAIVWNRDQRSGFIFNHEDPAQALSTGFNTSGVDVKFSWDFARFQHFPQIGILALKCPDKLSEIQQLAISQYASFMEQCSVGRNIHWASPMEVSIRLCNLLLGFDILNLLDNFKESLYLHWHFLQAHLEDKQGLGTNHYLSNLMGLVVAGYYFNNSTVQAKSKWAWQALEMEAQKQFYEDGINFEYSVYYHRLATELLLVAFAFAKKQELYVSEKFRQTLSNALRAIEVLKKPDGFLPQFGDNDSGRIIDLLPEGEWEASDFIPQPEKSNFLTSVAEPNSVYRWLYGELKSELPKPKEVPAQTVDLKFSHLKHQEQKTFAFNVIDTSALSVFHFAAGGLIVFKSQKFYLAINLMANSLGHRYRGHSHNDKGSLELQVHGQNHLQDPGVYSYTASAEIRNKWRQTEAHGVPFTGVEQNRYLPGNLGLFHLKLDTKIKLLHLSKTRCAFEVKYRGVRHIREIEIFPEKLLVTDSCNKSFKVNWNSKVQLTKGYGKLA